MSKAVLDINDKPKTGQLITLSLQHMFAMFGSTILVPTLTNLSPAIALLTSGIATLVFLLVTKFKVPAYLGSSFAFIAPIQVASAAGGPGRRSPGADQPAAGHPLGSRPFRFLPPDHPVALSVRGLRGLLPGR